MLIVLKEIQNYATEMLLNSAILPIMSHCITMLAFVSGPDKMIDGPA